MVTVNMQIEVSAVKGALDQIKRKIPSASRKAMALTATFIQNVIKDRTRQGRSVKGGAFKKYSKGYAKVRAKEGHQLTPNLLFSGNMLSNMSFKRLSNTKGQVFFPNRIQNIKAFFNDQTRPFFDVNRSEEDKAVEVFRKSFEKELRI